MRMVLVQMRKEMEAGQWRGMDKQKLAEEQAAQGGSTKLAPTPYMSTQYKEDAMRTTGRAIVNRCASTHFRESQLAPSSIGLSMLKMHRCLEARCTNVQSEVDHCTEVRS